MNTRSLGNSDVRVSELTLGTWGLGTAAYGEASSDANFESTVKAALDGGVTAFDTAPLWGDGDCERRLGRALKGAPGETVVITRAGLRKGEAAGEVREDYGVEALVEDCEGSLERLQRDVLDVWLLHDPSPEALESEDLHLAIERLEMEGKIRCWGASVCAAPQARAALEAGARVLCLPYNLLRPELLDELAPELAAQGAGVLVRHPLLYGLLSGYWSAYRSFDEGDHRKDRWTPKALSRRVAEVQNLRDACDPTHPDLVTLALRYCLGAYGVSSVLVGCRTPRHVEQVLPAAAPPGRLDAGTIRKISKIRKMA
jgi:aryl-alcohol dehydrogenase-like predicted oxidoreductase